ncbi:MAG: hypothetical protein O2917_00875 [Acidobacteria bacterium]|nr:hypothetical protein [Acidobacteriota bacterium]
MTRSIRPLLLALALVVVPALMFTSLSARQAAPAGPVAQATDATQWDGLRWRNIGPFVGGRVTAVAGHRSQPATYYLGGAGGGVFKTIDSGTTWRPISDGFFETGSIGAIEVADSDPNIIYVGTGSVAIRSNVIEGRGLYKSTDAGETWTHIGLRDAGQIGAIRVHPTNPNLVYAAVLGTAFGPSETRGVYRSRDGGQTWQRVKFVSTRTGFVNLAMNPSNPNEIYAAAWRGERKPWTIISGGPAEDGGLYKTMDGGETWTRLGGGLPPGIIGKIDVDISRSRPSTVYALVEAPRPQGGLYRSDDSGATWRLTSNAPNLLARPFYYTYVDVDPKDSDTVWVNNLSLLKSTDGGATWRSVPTPHGDNHGMWINPDNPNLIVQSNDGGANVSTDGGATWSTQSNQSTAELYGVEVDNQFPYRVYGAQQDNNTWVVMSKLPATGRYTLADTYMAGPGCETGPIRPTPGNPNVVYGVCKGEFYRRNVTTGQTQSNWNYPQNRYGTASRDIAYRFQRTSPFMISKHDPNMILHGSHVVHKTMDGGRTWEIISGDLTLNEPGPQQDISGEPITRDITGEEVYSALFAIEESPIEAGVIWTGANDGPVHVTRDNGKTWVKVTPPSMPPGGRISNIDPSPHRRGSAYVVAHRRLLNDQKPYVYLTNDYGATWSLLTPGTNGIPGDHVMRVVREDPEREGLLYAGTQFGFFVSFNNGRDWQRFQQNLPITPVTDIRVHQQDLVVSTMGRGFWILDNITPLHQTPAAGAAAFLYAPGPAMRARHGAMAGSLTTPELPGPGAVIDYTLREAANEPITLEILNASGEVMRTIRSVAGGGRTGGGLPVAAASGMTEPPLPGQGRGGGRGGRGGGSAAAPLTANAGMQRYVWNMLADSGLTVPPGKYTVRLTVGDWNQSQPLEVRLDPRLTADGITTEDLELQYDFNVRLRAKISESQQFTAAVQKAMASATGDAKVVLERIHKALVNEPDITYPQPMLNAQFQAITRVSNVADARPNNDAVRRLEDLEKELAALKAEAAKVGVR